MPGNETDGFCEQASHGVVQVKGAPQGSIGKSPFFRHPRSGASTTIVVLRWPDVGYGDARSSVGWWSSGAGRPEAGCSGEAVWGQPTGGEQVGWPGQDWRSAGAEVEASWSTARIGPSDGGAVGTDTRANRGQDARSVEAAGITNRGALAFMVFQGKFHNPVFIEFMKRLLRQAKGKLYLIVDGHPVHRSAIARRFVADNLHRLRLIRLPGYCPELNPDELLNQDVKTNALGKSRPTTKVEMMATVRRHLHRRQKQPRVIRNLFREKHVRYAA